MDLIFVHEPGDENLMYESFILNNFSLDVIFDATRFKSNVYS